MPTVKPRTYPVDTHGHTLRGDAAAAYLRMLADGMPAGGIDVFQRTWEEQQALYDRYRFHGGPIAAKPSTSAPHIDQRAFDSHTTTAGKYAPSSAHQWLTHGTDGSKAPRDTNDKSMRARTYGFTRSVPAERWHFEYNRALDTKREADLAARLKLLGMTLKAFQKSVELVPDGVDGPLTWAALLRATHPATPPMPPTPDPKPARVPTLARVATFNCGAWGRKSMTAKEIDCIVGVLFTLRASIYCLTECPEWLRDHIRGACHCPANDHKRFDGRRWLVRVRGSQAILRDSKKWRSGPYDSDKFGPTDYHGWLWEILTQTTTKAQLAVGAYHLPPNVVSSQTYQKNHLADFLRRLASGFRMVGGDGADDTGWFPGWSDARTSAAASADRAAKTYKGRAITDRIHVRGGVTVRRYTVVSSKGTSDHDAVLAQITIPTSTTTTL